MKYLALSLLLMSCSTPQVGESTIDDELSSDNGLSVNGISQNGLSLNGVSQNGISQNGLTLGMTTSSFATWFNADVTNHELEMRYVVKCARSSTDTVTWTNPKTRVSYSWPGLL